MQKKIIAAAGTLAVIGLGAGGAFTAGNHLPPGLSWRWSSDRHASARGP
jgi:hypothetical protein